MDLLWLILSLVGLALFQSLLFLALFFSTLLLNKRLFKKHPGVRMLLTALFITTFLSMAMTFGFGWWLLAATHTAHAAWLALVPPVSNLPGLYVIITRRKGLLENPRQD
ncbi:hypothetical protein [Sporolactobacillus vineae]|uniref:hypothetical protein n=1 Tax=Sporolactobacillus vineae TaxID=444463 RepID=UPI000287D37C|nr:hypothetical protein [Sporolactobacillus vineae]